MLLSFLKKSKSLIGIGDNNSNGDVAEVATIATEDPAIIVDPEELLKRMEDLRFTVYENIRTIRDPEKPSTLEDLDVVYEEGVQVSSLNDKAGIYLIRVEFNPTVPHCSLATLIGLCIRIKLQRSLLEHFKLDIYIKKGAHNTEEEINKQINDKERIAAAMENPNLKTMVENCIEERDE